MTPASPAPATVTSLCNDLAPRQRRNPSQRWPRVAAALGIALWVTGCAVPSTSSSPATSSTAAALAEKIHLPLLRGWFEGLQVLYITTDASDPDVARAQNANYAPALANALSAEPGSNSTLPANWVKRPGATDRVYGTTNFKQPSVFASAPEPMGYQSRATSYSPLWRLVKVTWNDPATARTLRSEEEVLDAAEKGQLTLEVTRIVLNCPIVHRGSLGALPGVTIDSLDSSARSAR